MAFFTLFCCVFAPAVKEPPASPKPSHKRALSDDGTQPSPAEAPPSPRARREPGPRSSLCINGSHVYGEEAAAPRPPPASAPLPVPRRPDEPLGFTPLHAEPHWGLGSLERAQQRDEPRFIPSPPSLALQEELKVSTKAVTLSNHLGRARMEESARLEGKAGQAAAPPGFPAEPAKDRAPEDGRKEDKKAKGGFFHHGGKGQGDRGTPVHASAAGDERSKSSGWFGSKEPKESPHKPRSVPGVWRSRLVIPAPIPVSSSSWVLLGALRQGQSREMLPCSKMSQREGIFLDPLLVSARNHLCWMWDVFCSHGREGSPPWRGEAQCGHTKWFCGLKYRFIIL